MCSEISSREDQSREEVDDSECCVAEDRSAASSLPLSVKSM